MIRIGIVDDDPGIVSILEDIISDHFEKFQISTAVTGQEAIEMIRTHRPDIVLLDYFLPDLDGLAVIREIRAVYSPYIIMISEVSDKEMIAKAYDENIEFFITKPINVIEVTSVIRRVLSFIEVMKTLDQFDMAIRSIRQGQPMEQDANKDDAIKRLFSKLGIMGQSGSDDLIRAVLWVRHQRQGYNLSEMYQAICLESDRDDNVYTVKKRIRRLITKVFHSMASLGNNDFTNPLFEEYASQLFPIAEIHKEMRYLEGKSMERGKINIRQFIESIVVLID